MTWWVMSSTITVVGLLAMGAMVWLALSPYRVAGTVAVARGNGTSVPLGAIGAPPTRWSVHLGPTQGLGLSGEVGTLEIADGMLGYTAQGSTVPDWRFPVNQLRAQFHLRVLVPANIDLWLPTGLLMIEVDRTRIRPWLRTSFANIRRPREAHVFLQILGANGAQVSATPRWPIVPGERMLR